MKTSEFLAVAKGAGGPGRPARIYAAFARGATAEAQLTLWTADGKFHGLPYGSLQFMDGDALGWTRIRLNFGKARIDLTGRQLAPVVDAIRTRACAHVYEFNGGRYDPPEPGQAIITEIGFAFDRTATTAARS